MSLERATPELLPPGAATYLALEPDPVLAFLHLPAGVEPRATAVLICPPFGWDEMCSYRARRRWAQELAAAGYPSARLDLPGSGDSGGSPTDPGRLEAWTAAISQTATWLRGQTGCERVAAIGIGLGGMLAYRAAAQAGPIDDLILWAVPARGRRLLRELRTYAGVATAGHADDASHSSLPAGALELIGFLISPETAREIEALQLLRLTLPERPGRRVLLLGRDGLGIDEQLREHLEQTGVAVTVADADDYGVMMNVPQESRAPLATIEKTIAWLGETAPARSEARSAPQGAEPTITLGAIRETVVEFDLGVPRLFGVLAEPAQGAPASVCAVLLNSGALHHIGPNRTWVEVARRWAGRGIPTLRLDLAGIGESDGDEGRLLPNPSLYSSDRTEETIAVLDRLAARGLPDQFVLAGVCSGAYWSLHAALADDRVRGALMVNLYSFFWTPDLVAERDSHDSLMKLRKRGLHRLRRRKVAAGEMREVLGNLRPSRIRAGVQHPVERAQTKALTKALDQLRDQGTEALLLLSRQEPLRDQLARGGHLEQLSRWPNLRVETIPSHDHLFRAMWLQELVQEQLDQALERVLDAVPAAASSPPG